MKKRLMLILMALALTGCKTVAEIKPDTIVDIPLRPTEAASEAVTEARSVPTETEPAGTEAPETEPPTEAVTEKPDNSASGSKSSGGKSSGGAGNSGKAESGSVKPTQSPTEAPTQPPTEAPTQPPTEAPTEAPTEPPTEAPTQPPAFDPADYIPGSLDLEVAEAVNARRQEAGLEALAFDSSLCALASVRARELTLVWGHCRPDGSDGMTVLTQYGYAHGWAAENIYNGPFGGEAIAARWMTADSTAGNLLHEAAAAIGVASCTTPEGLTYVAAIFAG